MGEVGEVAGPAPDPAVVTPALVRALVRLHLGFDLDDALAERLVPRVVALAMASRDLRQLDLGEMDPRGFDYLHDRRLPR